jgi:tetratricopeptide (TPR) repeat protein
LLRRAALALLLSGAFAVGVDPGDEEGSGDPEYVRGRQAIEAKDWQGAVRLLSSAALRDTRNADIQNYLGYAYRNMGEMPLAFKHYSRALQLDPRHRGAHEYLAEAYLMINKAPRGPAENLPASVRRVRPPREKADRVPQGVGDQALTSSLLKSLSTPST